MSSESFLLRVAPILFVLIWSTGWVVAGYAAPHADSLTFLSLRYALAILALGGVTLLAGAPWPRDRRSILNAMIAGVLLHGIYLGGVWWAVRHGLPAGVSGLLAALQPILTALLAPRLLGERLTPLRWAGIVLGLLGIVLVLWPKLAAVEAGMLGKVAVPILINAIGMLAVTAGFFFQKKMLQGGDLRSITTLQYVGALLVTLPVAALTEPMQITWNLTMVLVTIWSVLALSLGAIGLLMMLIRRGEVSRAATLIYLIPPTVAVEAWLLFGETLSAIQLAGIAVTVVGVALASRSAAAGR